jgi:single-strand selective monofunctional uracil DNA glycosylase
MIKKAIGGPTESEVVAVVARLAKRMRDALMKVDYSADVPWVYHPLDYAWQSHQHYIELFAGSPKRVLFVGMNPGPWGMVQTGVPFGEVAAVSRWMGISVPVKSPRFVHPKRPIEGFHCKRSEVSGRRFWGLLEKEYKTPQKFFRDQFVVNYCPVAFMEESGRNVTPDKLSRALREQIEVICNEHLAGLIDLYRPAWVVGIGGFAEKCSGKCVQLASAKNQSIDTRIGKLLHPSPASPAANKNWEQKALEQLRGQKIWG